MNRDPLRREGIRGGFSEPPPWLSRPGAWFWIVTLLGLAGRLYLACMTRGTTDADLWTEHAGGVYRDGLIQHYVADTMFNHPPFMAYVMAALFGLSETLKIEFRVVYRVIFSFVDWASVWLLVSVLGQANQWRYLAGACYAVAPVALVLAGMHGNTDALVSTALLLCCLVVARGNPVLAGVCIGLSAWIKVPALFAAPAFGFAFARTRERLICAAVALAVAAVNYLPALAMNPAVVWDRIFGYRGLFIYTATDPPTWVWGLQIWITRIYGGNIANWPEAYQWFREHSFWIALPLAVLFGYFRSRQAERHDAHSLAITVAGTYAIFYAFTEPWAFQYFARSMPFWLVAGWPFALAAHVFGGGYIYVLYASLSKGDWLLRPFWSLGSVDRWPWSAILLRDLAYLSFVYFAIGFLRNAIKQGSEARPIHRAALPVPRKANVKRKSR